ncbi:lipase secretion chaperone [Acinetobacter sp. ANC 3832]|uniref:lipase secretion chaperone n=1 Tax=Acinetobacter sp. ANC 3832 TaxID=1977874 RepID=UPI00148A9DCA|nr:lipase secretion chaperone [Acinetobacter sp. ANC 3832]
MDGMFKYKKMIFLIVVLISFLFIFWYLKPEDQKNIVTESQVRETSPNKDGENLDHSLTINGNEPLKFKGNMPTLAPSLSGTEVNCPLKVDDNGQLLLTRGIRDCFDYFLSSSGEKSDTALLLDIRQYLSGLLPDTAQPYAFKLLDKYIDYLNQLKNLNGVEAQDVTEFKRVSSSLSKLRRQIFTTEEANIFFRDEEIYDQYAIDDYAIFNDKSLTPEQKAKKSVELLEKQPPSITDRMKPIIQYNQLQKLTAEIKEKGGSQAELAQMRKQLVGVDAADRLAKLDNDNAQWQNKVDQYLQSRQQIITTQQKGYEQEKMVTELRNNFFNNEGDRLRAETFEEIYDQNSNVKKMDGF